MPVSDQEASGQRPSFYFQSLGGGPSSARPLAACRLTPNPNPRAGQRSRRWLGGSPIKLVLELAFSLGEGVTLVMPSH